MAERNSKVVLLQSTARSGTTWLRSLLASSPAVSVYGEFLHPDIFDWGFFGYWQGRVLSGTSTVSPEHMREAMVDYLRCFDPPAPKQVAVLDMKLEQLRSVHYVFPAMYYSGAKVIVLQRRNLLKQVVSEAVMYARQAQKDAPPVHSEAVPPVTRVRIEPQDLILRMKNKRDLQEEYLQHVRGCGTPHVILTYEEVAAAPQVAADMLFDFMGVPRVRVTSVLKKQNPHPISDILLNFAEVRSALRGGEFEKMLHLPS